jgi:hypothetical protein
MVPPCVHAWSGCGVACAAQAAAAPEHGAGARSHAQLTWCAIAHANVGFGHQARDQQGTKDGTNNLHKGRTSAMQMCADWGTVACCAPSVHASMCAPGLATDDATPTGRLRPQHCIRNKPLSASCQNALRCCLLEQVQLTADTAAHTLSHFCTHPPTQLPTGWWTNPARTWRAM